MTLPMGNRLKKMKSYALPPELLERLEAYRLAQVVPPSATSVLEAALRMFLDAQKSAANQAIAKKSTRKN